MRKSSPKGPPTFTNIFRARFTREIDELRCIIDNDGRHRKTGAMLGASAGVVNHREGMIDVKNDTPPKLNHSILLGAS
jgi:hypothetical protein